MITLSPKTLSPFQFLRHKPYTTNSSSVPIPIPIPVPILSHSKTKPLFSSNINTETEREICFNTGDSFFRHESAIGRDLAVLAAAIHKKENGYLRVLDALCGCGVRSLRYLVQSGADFVLANDGNDEYNSLIVSNLSQVSLVKSLLVKISLGPTLCWLMMGMTSIIASLCAICLRSLRYMVQSGADFVLANVGNDEYNSLIVFDLSQVPMGSGDEKRWKVTHCEANRVMADCYLQKDYFDLVDVDSFGSDSTFLRSALGALKLGGLLYVTCTDGFSSGGHRPYHCLAAYGAYVRNVPFCNEVGLRMLIGGAVREASVLGYHVTPLFSYYSLHGPVFRVMLRLGRGKLLNNRHYGFIGYCENCGHSQTISWDNLGRISCPCSPTNVSDSLVIIGPLWTGPLHNGIYISEMLNLAEHWGWTDNTKVCELEKLLRRMVDESDSMLPPGYTDLDEVAKRAKVNSPPLRKMIDILHKEGYAASRSHIAFNSIKTNCPMVECMRIARDINRPE